VGSRWLSKTYYYFYKLGGEFMNLRNNLITTAFLVTL
jgi:hypothetical protein